jgi:uncharacterized lipoprotein YddW (UPF0748 family)
MDRLRLLLFICCTLLAAAAQATSIVIDSFAYPNAAAAQAHWVAVDGSPAVTLTADDGLQLTVPFASPMDRVYWDRSVALDLQSYDTLTLELTCPDPAALRSLAIYFKSGNGWYVHNQPLTRAGRQTVTLQRAAMTTEGTPSGWHQIEAIRISPWKGTPQNTQITLHRFTAHQPGLLIIRNQAAPATELSAVTRSTRRISQWLTDLHMPHAVVDDTDLTAPQLVASRIAVLPFNPTLSDRLFQQLKRFVEGGGKLIIFYSDHPGLANLMGVRLGSYTPAEHTGHWAAMRFNESAPPATPTVVYQTSWNIRPVYPAAPHARVIAQWHTALDKETGEPAWVLTRHGAWMSHILLSGDDQQKRRLLGSLAAHLDPALYPALARYTMQQAVRVGPYTSLENTLQHLTPRVPETRYPRWQEQVREQYRRMHVRWQDGDYPLAIQQADALHRTLLRAYALAQPSQPETMRGVWDHDAAGLFPGDWPRTMALLAQHGINNVFVNILWAGVAHYPSQHVPYSNLQRIHGDQLQQAIEAGRQHNIAVHAWVVCWNMTGAPEDWKQQMTDAGRTIQSDHGTPVSWLNPTHPKNQQLLLDTLHELDTHYDLASIHLDYFRYAGPTSCTAPFTRQAFETAHGKPVANWPAAVLNPGETRDAFLRFRVDTLNDLMQRVRQTVKQPLSAAVWGNYPNTIQHIGQDWGHWMRQGWIDFVVPMNYTDNITEFGSLLAAQQPLQKQTGIPIYPGIGVTSTQSRLTPDQVIDQIGVTRANRTDGWVLYQLSPALADQVLPYLSLGASAP